MKDKIDEPLIKLEMVLGYKYPLPPKTRLSSLRPNVSPIVMPRMTINQWPQVQNDGTTVKIFTTVMRHPSVLVMPVDSNGKVMLVKTTQPGRPEYNGLVAGDLDPNSDESVFCAARRELLEETGYEADRFHLVYFHYFVAGWDWFAYTLIAENCRKVQEPPADVGEHCTPFFVDVDELERMARQEEFLYPPILVNKLLLRNEGDKLRRLFQNPVAFAAMSSVSGE